MSPRRRVGPQEAAVQRDLERLPEADRNGALAALALNLARRLDAGPAGLRDTASVARELRATLVEIANRVVPLPEADPLDDLAERRASRRATG